jgi:serine phosphatase RsbU (regulator of sigma subunit)/predicted ester cyclase
LARRREAPVSSEEEKNKALVRRFLEEVHTKGNLDAIDELLSPDFVDHSLMPGQEADREGYKRAVVEMRAAFSHQRQTIEDQIAEGDKVFTRVTTHVIQDQEYLGLAPTGEELAYTGMRVHRIAGDKIIEEWTEVSIEPWQQRLEQEISERERVEQELKVARRIQQASLPKEVPTLEGWEISPYYRPAREVGGDFYEFFELDEGRVGFAVGDATGKGVPAAFVMSATCALLGGVATASGASPGEVLTRINEAVLTRIPPNMFVTCFYAILDPKSGLLSYANAGHDLPYVRHGSDAEELRARGMPLGLMPGMNYEEKEIILQAGESVLFYSDGLVEAHDPQGEMFGFPRLRDLVAEHGEKRSLGEFLLEELYSFVGEDWEQEDDITLLTLRRSSAP